MKDAVAKVLEVGGLLWGLHEVTGALEPNIYFSQLQQAKQSESIENLLFFDKFPLTRG